MYQALRAVKVTPPQLQLRDVQRPRLLAMLDRAIERPVTLICAGPGYGKTVLVNQWASARPDGVVWVSLDPQDDREARFWTLVQFALQRAGFGSTQPQSGGHSLAEHAIDELAEAARQTEDLLILVLDDVHVVSDPDVTATLNALLKHPPPKLRVIMTARSDPVIPLHRYRIQGYLSEIRAADLAMTAPEIEELLTLHDLHLAPLEVESLAVKTEGWVAGVRLSAMRMEQNSEPGGFITDFAMDRGSVGEYLMEEVLGNQPREVQDLLIRTSVCDPVSGPLADAICESGSGGDILNELVTKNCFVTALDHKGERFQYHPLLRDVLGHLLHREPAAVQRRGHQNAARWYASEGNLVQALEHAVAGHDWELSSDLLCGGAFEELYLGAATRTVSGIG